MAPISRAEIVTRVARQYGNYKSITATGGSTTTVISTSGLYEPEDYWVGHFAYVLTDAGGESAAPEDEERPITDYVQSTATLTVNPAFTAAIVSTDILEILRIRRSDIVAMVNAAIRMAGRSWLVNKTDDSTVTIATEDYDYTLPTDIVNLLAVYSRDQTSDPWRKVGGHQWRIAGTPDALELVLRTLEGLANGDLVRLEYLARPSALATADATLGLGEDAETEMVEYIIAMTLALLNEQAASDSPLDKAFRSRLTLSSMQRERAEIIKKNAVGFHGPATMKSHRWPRCR